MFIALSRPNENLRGALIIAFERQVEDFCSTARKAKRALFENKAAFA
jgi:hypothetical protein